MNKYANELMDCASKLDAMVEGYGHITQMAASIISKQSEEDTINLLRRLSDISEDKKVSLDIKKMSALLKDNLVKFYGHERILEICRVKPEQFVVEKSLSELLYELNDLVGLKSVKAKVNDLIIYQKIQKLRRENNLHCSKSTLHLAFLGNPGTGKTTVARIVGQMYKKIGLLSKGHFFEVSRTDLIAGYQGQTALKVKKVIEKAKGGVLFIDEAYSITENENSDSYGRECLTELTKALEDYRDDLVVIVAGYTEPMRKFFKSNPGLKSRFNHFIEFEDYSPDDLLSILKKMCKENDYLLSEEATNKINKYFCEEVENRDENFANGRMVRNVYDDIVMNHARRIASFDSQPSKEDLSLIQAEDFLPPQLF